MWPGARNGVSLGTIGKYSRLMTGHICNARAPGHCTGGRCGKAE